MSAAAEEAWPLDGSIILYGAMADLMLLVPLIIYMVMEDTNNWGSYHQTYITMLWSAYAPLGISWFFLLVEDSIAARTAVTGAIEMAGLGPMALLWVGWASLCLSAKSANLVDFADNLGLAIWTIVYPVINVLLIIMHYHVSPPMYAWLAQAPQAYAEIDNAQPWAKSMKAIEIAPIEIAPIEIAPIEIAPIEIAVPTVEVEVAAPTVEVDAGVDASADASASADADLDIGGSASVSVDVDADFE